MALTFDSTDKLQTSTSGITWNPTDWPTTMMGWVKPSIVETDTIISYGDKDSNTDLHYMGIIDNGASDNNLRAPVFTTTNNTIQGTSTTGTGSWVHALTRAGSSTDRELYFNGTSDATDTDSDAYPSAVDMVAIGRLARSNNEGPIDADLGECCIWSSNLSDATISALSRGANPFIVDHDNLEVYCPLYGVHSQEPDYGVNRYSFDDVSGTTKASNHPPVEPLENYL